MFSYTQLLVIIGAAQGILLFALLNLDSKTSTANRILGLFCLFLAIFFLTPLIHFDGELNAFSGLLGWSFFLPASFGALNYLYYRHAVTETKLRWIDCLHIAPILTCYLLNLNWLTESPEYRLGLFKSGFDPMPPGLQVSLFIFYLQAFIYNGFSAWLIYRYQNKAQNTLANFNPDIFKWLWTFLTLTLIIWTIKLTSDIRDSQTLSVWGDFLIVIFIYCVAIAQWRNPRLFRVDKLDSIDNTESVTTEFDERQEHTSGNLDESTRISLLSTIKDFMEEHKPYLDNQLTLTTLSDAVGLSNHNLSEVLNQQEGKNFYQFVNRYRVNHLIKLLEQDKHSKILDLALASGFSSKSTFNAVFKQFTDLTPTQYRKNLNP